MAKDPQGKGIEPADKAPSQLEREIEATRIRLAGTIDELVFRAHPKTIVAREVASVKAYFVEPDSGEPRTENVLKVVGGVVGVVVLFVVVRRVTR